MIWFVFSLHVETCDVHTLTKLTECLLRCLHAKRSMQNKAFTKKKLCLGHLHVVTCKIEHVKAHFKHVDAL